MENAQRRALIGIAPITWMEVMWGARDKTAQRKAVSFLQQFEMVYLIQADMDWAMQQLQAHRLSHSVDILDCLIASVAYRLHLTLYTTNIEHFAPLPGALAIQPY
jgi:predicted nucleic acid-binding protein